MARIPLHDVIAQNRSIQTELDAAWQAVNELGIFVNGPQVEQFEESFSNYIGPNCCVGVGNATDGFEIAFQALSLQYGDEIIIPSNAHVSPALAALKVGLKPVFCDVDETRMLLNRQTVSAQVSDRTKAVIAVHLYGRVCPMKELKQLCEEQNLILIEDFSQAHGANYKNQKVGSMSDVAVCSFYPTKPLGALGDGGAIVTSNSILGEKCRTLANYGWNKRDDSSLGGRNSRLDELQAACLGVKLSHLERWNLERMEKARQLGPQLNELNGVSVAELKEGDVCHLLVIRTEVRDELRNYLLKHGVDSQVHYPIPIHQQQLFSSEVDLPVAQKLSKQVLSVPLNEKVVELVRNFS